MRPTDSQDEPSFGFVTDESLRSSMLSDYAELCVCMAGGAWKAALVLSGSVIEALLTDYLLAIQHPADTLKLEFAKLIEVCHQSGVLSVRAKDLCTVIRGYRNLIHPGRQIRLNEIADRDGAEAARALVRIIASEVARRKEETYGLTAEQVAEKLVNHPQCVVYLDELIKGVRETERTRLLDSILPDRYFSLPESGEAGDQREAIRDCFRRVFDLVPDPVKKRIVANYLGMLRGERAEKIGRYESAFFRAKDLRYAEVGERAIAKMHLLDRLDKTMSRQYIKVLEGIGEFLEPPEVEPFLAYTMVIYHVSHLALLTRLHSMRFLRRECGIMNDQAASEARRLLRSYLEDPKLTDPEREPFVGIFNALEGRFA